MSEFVAWLVCYVFISPSGTKYYDNLRARLLLKSMYSGARNSCWLTGKSLGYLSRLPVVRL